MRLRGRLAVPALAVALASALYGAAPTSAAGDRIETQVRRTVSCSTALGAVQISAFASNPTIGSANASVTTGKPNPPTGLLGLSNQQKQYGLSSRCRRVTTRVALTHRGLTSAGASSAGDVRWSTVFCSATRRVLVRFVLGLDAAGKPVSATIAVRTRPKQTGAKSKPIGFVQWSPKRSVTYYSSACTVQDE